MIDQKTIKKSQHASRCERVKEREREGGREREREGERERERERDPREWVIEKKS